jgi:hypothetical protein
MDSENESNNSLNDFLNTIDIEQNQMNVRNTLANHNELAKLELLNFTRNLIKKAEAKNELKDRVVQILMDRLSDPDQVADIPIGVLSNLYEKLSRNDNDFIGHILNGMRSSASNNVQVNLGDTQKHEKELNPQKENIVNSINKEDYQSIRNVLTFVNKIKNSGEFSELEDEQQI